MEGLGNLGSRFSCKIGLFVAQEARWSHHQENAKKLEAERFAQTVQEYEDFIAAYGSPQPDPDLPLQKLPSGKVRKYESYCCEPHSPPKGLSSETHKRCSEGEKCCGWLKCECGGCYCGMPAERKATGNKYGKAFSVKIQYIPGAYICPECIAKPCYMKEGEIRFCGACEGRGYDMTNKYT